MDRSLDEIIAERPQKSSNRDRTRPRRQNNWPRDGVKKPFREDRTDLNLDWVHDKFEDDRDTRSYRGRQDRRGDMRQSEPEQSGAKLRITGLHYDLGEDDLEGLFTQIGPVSSLRVIYDRAGRSEGVAYVTYKRLTDAKTAIREFDGANAKGQPIHLSLVSSGGPGGRRDDRRNPFDNVEKPKGSLFDRVERPRERDNRTLSPEMEADNPDDTANGNRGKRHNGVRRSDVTKPPPDHIDRYVPGQRSPRRRNDGGRSRGRRPGERGEIRARTDSAAGGRQGGTARPKKTQEELDQEMDDYWATTNTNGNGDDANLAPSATEPPAAVPATGDDDIDMIE